LPQRAVQTKLWPQKGSEDAKNEVANFWVAAGLCACRIGGLGIGKFNQHSGGASSRALKGGVAAALHDDKDAANGYDLF
jgi:hypothetical protein